MDSQTLLPHIGWRLGAPERVAVEALSHILTSSEAARHSLGDTLQRAGVEGDPVVRAATRSVGETGERRLLAVFDAQGAQRAGIEAVFWGGRPTAYEPPHNGPAGILFVAPIARCETFWTGLCKEATAKSRSASAVEEPWSTAAADGRRVALISWTTLLGRMSGAANAAGEAQAQLDIRELRQFAGQQEETDFLPLRSDELSPRLPRRVRSLRRLIDNAVAQVCDKGWKYQWCLTNRNGYYVQLVLSDMTIRFGMHLELWKHHGLTPLWLIVHKPGGLTVDEVRRRLKPSLASLDAWTPSVPIKLPVAVEEDEVLDAVVQRLQVIARMLEQDSGSGP